MVQYMQKLSLVFIVCVFFLNFLAMQKRETASIKGDKEGSILVDKWMNAYVLH